MNREDNSSLKVSGRAPLGRNERAFIVLLALLQGLLLYLAEYGHAHAIWPLSELYGQVCWYTLVLTVPTLMMFSLQSLGQGRFWWQSVLLIVAYVALAIWAARNATGAPGLEAHAVLFPFGASLGLGSFVLLPYLQWRMSVEDAGGGWPWRASYPALFDHAWQNTLALAFAGVTVGLGWAVLILWGELFKLIDIRFFHDLFREKPFVYLATGLFFGLGVLIGRTQEKPVRIARQILFALFAGVLPVLSFIALLFIVALPFTGLAPLWRTGHATFILASLLVFQIVFLNAVVQDGQGPSPYPSLVRRMVSAAILVSPLYAVLALYALGLRIGQYGWTPERLWGVLAILGLGVHALGYALAIVRRWRVAFWTGEGAWLPGLARVNVWASLGLVGLIFLFDSPVLDPHRISIQSQLARFEAAPAGERAKALDLAYLRFSAGRQGYEALQALAGMPLVQEESELTSRVRMMLERTERYPSRQGAVLTAEPANLTQAQERIRLAPGAVTPEEDFYAFLVTQASMTPCLAPGSDCLLLSPDVDADGEADMLLCDLSRGHWVRCELSTRENGEWRRVGQAEFAASSRAGGDELREGRLNLEPPSRWWRLRLGADGPVVEINEAPR